MASLSDDPQRDVDENQLVRLQRMQLRATILQVSVLAMIGANRATEVIDHQNRYLPYSPDEFQRFMQDLQPMLDELNELGA